MCKCTFFAQSTREANTPLRPYQAAQLLWSHVRVVVIIVIVEDTPAPLSTPRQDSSKYHTTFVVAA